MTEEEVVSCSGVVVVRVEGGSRVVVVKVEGSQTFRRRTFRRRTLPHRTVRRKDNSPYEHFTVRTFRREDTSP